MISVIEAKRLLQQRVKPLEPVVLHLNHAAGCVLATDIFAPANLPLAPQAAMDGYAFQFDSWQHQVMVVNGAVAAGDAGEYLLQPNEAVRIFTGAYLPANTDTVVMQEKVQLTDAGIVIEDAAIKKGTNVRPTGSEIAKGTPALKRGICLTPGAIGFLAMMGISEVAVVPRPKVAILVTGKELQPPGTLFEKGKIYEANSYTLLAALKCLGISDVFVRSTGDDPDPTSNAIQEALGYADILLITGGISVGDYDFVLPASLQCDIEKVFHKVAQKPGKPLFFGMKGTKPVFGLPGNPASVLTCFYQYVVLVLGILRHKKSWTSNVQLPLLQPVQKKGGLTHFLKGCINEKGVSVLGAQESYRLSSFAIADCLIELPEAAESIEAGTLVTVYPFHQHE